MCAKPIDVSKSSRQNVFSGLDEGSAILFFVEKNTLVILRAQRGSAPLSVGHRETLHVSPRGLAGQEAHHAVFVHVAEKRRCSTERGEDVWHHAGVDHDHGHSRTFVHLAQLVELRKRNP